MDALAFAETPQTFCERVSRLLEKVDYRLALDDDDRDEIYRLRYDAYLHEGAIGPSFSRRFQDKFDDKDRHQTTGSQAFVSVLLCPLNAS
jgi:hypothetical protein